MTLRNILSACAFGAAAYLAPLAALYTAVTLGWCAA